MVTSVASIVTTPLSVITRPVICSHLPVSRFNSRSNSKPGPFGFLPVTHAANSSSLITQSTECFRLADGRSPNRLPPRNCPLTVTTLPSSFPGLVTSSSSVTCADDLRGALSSGGPRNPQTPM